MNTCALHIYIWVNKVQHKICIDFAISRIVPQSLGKNKRQRQMKTIIQGEWEAVETQFPFEVIFWNTDGLVEASKMNTVHHDLNLMNFGNIIANRND